MIIHVLKHVPKIHIFVSNKNRKQKIIYLNELLYCFFDSNIRNAILNRTNTKNSHPYCILSPPDDPKLINFIRVSGPAFETNPRDSIERLNPNFLPASL